MIYGEEQGFLNYDFVNYRFTSIWDWTTNFGKLTTGYTNLFTTGLFWKIAHSLGFSLLFTEKLYLFTIIFLISLFAYLLFFRLVKDKLIGLLLSLTLITIFNLTISLTTTPKILHFLVTVSSIYFWHMFTETKKLRYVVFNALSLYLLLGISINVPQMLGAYMFIILYCLLFSDKKNIKATIVFLIPLVITILFVYAINQLVLKNSGEIFRFDPLQTSFAATTSRLRDIFRFFGGWWDYEGSGQLEYNHLSWYYNSFIGKLITVLPTVLFFYLLIFQKNKKRILKIIFLVLVSLMLVKGTTQPFNSIFTYFFDIPIFRIFREPWAKFIPSFIISVLIALAYFSKEHFQGSKIVIISVLSIVVLFQSGAVVMGKIIDHRNIDWKKSDVRIPDYWLQFNTWTKEQARDKRILFLPANKTVNSRLPRQWSPVPFGGEPAYYFAYTNILLNEATTPEEELAMTTLYKNLNPTTLALASIDYVVYQNDAIKSNDSVGLETIMDAVDENKKMSFGALDVYPVKQSLQTQKMRTVSKIGLADNICPLEKTPNKDIDGNTAMIFSPSQQVPLDIETIPLKTTKISEGIYKVTLQAKPQKTVGLLFGDMFNSNWKMYSTTNNSKPLISENNHYIANCFANFWIIDKQTLSKNSTFYIILDSYIHFQKLISTFYLFYFGYIGLFILIGAFVYFKKSPIFTYEV